MRPTESITRGLREYRVTATASKGVFNLIKPFYDCQAFNGNNGKTFSSYPNIFILIM